MSSATRGGQSPPALPIHVCILASVVLVCVPFDVSPGLREHRSQVVLCRGWMWPLDVVAPLTGCLLCLRSVFLGRFFSHQVLARVLQGFPGKNFVLKGWSIMVNGGGSLE